MCNSKKNMRDLARDIRGLASALNYDAECLLSDVETYDLMCLGESIHDTKITIQRVMDKATELEYQLYLIRRDAQVDYLNETRNLHSPLCKNNDN